MKSILSIVPEEIKEKVDSNIILNKLVIIGRTRIIPNWFNYVDRDLYYEMEHKFLVQFYKRYLTRFKFNKMIIRKIFRDKYQIEPVFLNSHIKAYLFPTIEDLFKIV
tara:strand:+ start:851 stop:1171 length:321 start_codon:yes stop_codon:yes gene_type:complete